MSAARDPIASNGFPLLAALPCAVLRPEGPQPLDEQSPLYKSLLRTTAAQRVASALWQRIGNVAEPDLPRIAVEFDGRHYAVEYDGTADDGIEVTGVLVGEVDILPLLSGWAISALTNAATGELMRQAERDHDDSIDAAEAYFSARGVW